MVQRLQQFYENKIVPQLTEQFTYKNKHQVPDLEKIVIEKTLKPSLISFFHDMKTTKILNNSLGLLKFKN